MWGDCRMAEQGSSLALRRVCHSFTQARCRVSKVQQKTCLLGEQRTRAPSIPALSWRILDEPQHERLLLNHEWRWDSWPPEEKNSIRGQRRGLITQSFCVIEFYLKYKRDRESFWHRYQKGQKECPLASVSNRVIYLLISYYNEWKEYMEVVETFLEPLP